jgi:hypothetical protein
MWQITKGSGFSGLFEIVSLNALNFTEAFMGAQHAFPH